MATLSTLATAGGTNDLYRDSTGNLAVVTDLDAVSNICACVARTIAGECVLNTDIGLPDFQKVWSGNPDVAGFEDALLKALQGVRGVTEVLAVTATRSRGILQYTAVIRTIFGAFNLNG